jgi:16S rRNA A1518/A1519 N6-dimethyltransferase RsmA/KsgA/DIM1 with predicted DNA glycosylase/AP lyase activity
VLRIRPLVPAPLSDSDELHLRTLTRTAFSWRRKQLQKTLRSSPEYALEPEELAEVQRRTGIEMDRRPEQLSPGEFISMARALRDVREAAHSHQAGSS